MSGSDKADTHSGDAHGRPADGSKVVGKKKLSGRPADVGRALRSVYDDTLREDIPSDLKDLLGRLG
ncbi:MAG: NepR family anti-sigma factor [Sphingomicrobium sp.]